MIAITATVVVGFALMAWTQGGMATAPPDNAAGGTELTIDNFVFGPSTLPVASDTTVTWTATMYLIPSSATTKLPSNQRLSIQMSGSLTPLRSQATASTSVRFIPR